MKNKTVLITGGTSGLGKETAKALATRGATVVFTSRDHSKGENARQDIISASHNEDVHVMLCDLASLSAVQSFCSEYDRTFTRLDVLLHNAGTWDFSRRESRDGIENIFAVNYLAPFLMTRLLLPKLIASRPSRIISVVSGLHWGTIQFDNLEFKRNFSGFKAYRQSKLALLLFTRLLARTLHNKGVTVNCAEPGMVATDLSRDAGFVSRTIFRTFGRTPERGAETSVLLASSEQVANITGECFSGTKIGRTSEQSKDLETARKLWEISEHYVRDYI